MYDGQQRFYHWIWDQNIDTHRGVDNQTIGPLSSSYVYIVENKKNMKKEIVYKMLHEV